jgi:hypothetical protein
MTDWRIGVVSQANQRFPCASHKSLLFSSARTHHTRITHASSCHSLTRPRPRHDRPLRLHHRAPGRGRDCARTAVRPHLWHAAGAGDPAAVLRVHALQRQLPSVASRLRRVLPRGGLRPGILLRARIAPVPAPDWSAPPLPHARERLQLNASSRPAGGGAR